MPILQRKCNDCEHRFELLSRKRSGVWTFVDLTGDDDTSRESEACPQCGSDTLTHMVTAGVGVDLGGPAGVGRHFPYYDRSLKLQVKSAAHRRQVCKERGLTPVDGDFDIGRDMCGHHAEEERQADAWRALKKQYSEDSRFADFRRLKDRGYYSDLARRKRDA